MSKRRGKNRSLSPQEREKKILDRVGGWANQVMGGLLVAVLIILFPIIMFTMILVITPAFVLETAGTGCHDSLPLWISFGLAIQSTAISNSSVMAGSNIRYADRDPVPRHKISGD